MGFKGVAFYFKNLQNIVIFSKNDLQISYISAEIVTWFTDLCIKIVYKKTWKNKT